MFVASLTASSSLSYFGLKVTVKAQSIIRPERPKVLIIPYNCMFSICSLYSSRCETKRDNVIIILPRHNKRAQCGSPKAPQELSVSSHHWCAFQSQFCRHHRNAARWGLLRLGYNGQHSGWWSSQWGRPDLPSAHFLWWASWSSPLAFRCQWQKAVQWMKDIRWQVQSDCC